MNNQEYSTVLAEVYIVINKFDREMYLKIPEYLIKFIDDNRDKNYHFEYDSSKKIKDQSLKEETMHLVSGIYLNYCVDESDKKRLLAICDENEKKRQNEFNEKYSYENLFKNKEKNISKENVIDEQNYVGMIEYKKQNFFVSILKKFLDLLKKNK